MTQFRDTVSSSLNYCPIFVMGIVIATNSENFSWKSQQIHKLRNFIFIDSLKFEYFLFLPLTMTCLMSRMTPQVSPYKIIMYHFEEDMHIIKVKKFQNFISSNIWIITFFQALGSIWTPRWHLKVNKIWSNYISQWQWSKPGHQKLYCVGNNYILIEVKLKMIIKAIYTYLIFDNEL